MFYGRRKDGWYRENVGEKAKKDGTTIEELDDRK